ncbi:MAG: thioredoxin domain-containing protein [Chloroflexi bacterium]|nr:thioredoxin domain-containing protein [Chloroflexota bacterium]
MYPGQVRFVYHHYPYHDDNDFSWTIAEALEAAGAQDMFWEMHDRITEDVPENIGEMEIAAQDIKIPDIGRFFEELNDRVYMKTVGEAIEEAEANNVNEVSLFVDLEEYRKYPGKLEDLTKMIDDRLNEIVENAED